MATNTNRILLRWTQPLLPQAAAHLIDHYVDEGVADLRPATLVLPGRRARRRIIELLLDEALREGAVEDDDVDVEVRVER